MLASVLHASHRNVVPDARASSIQHVGYDAKWIVFDVSNRDEEDSQ